VISKILYIELRLRYFWLWKTGKSTEFFSGRVLQVLYSLKSNFVIKAALMGPVSKTPFDKTLTRLDADKEFGRWLELNQIF